MTLNAASASFNPQVLAEMIRGGFANAPILYGSGAAEVDTTMPYGRDYLGLAINIPYSSLPNSWTVLSDGSPLTPMAFSIGNAAGNSTTPETETVLRAGISLDMTTWARSNPLDPYGEARRQMLLGYAQAMENQLITKATASAGWGSYTLDISTAADPLLNHDAIVNATQKLGAEGFNDPAILLAVHSHTVASMWTRKNALGMPWLIGYAGEVTPNGAQIFRLMPFGTPVYVSDLMPISAGTGPGGTDVYTSALFRRGAMALYVNPNLSARSVQEPNTDSQTDALNCYFVAHRRKRLQNRANPGVALITHQ